MMEVIPVNKEENRMFTQRLAEFVVNTDTRDIPAEVLDRSRHAIVDTLGCALAGTLEPVAGLAAQWLDEIGARPRATVWGGELKT